MLARTALLLAAATLAAPAKAQTLTFAINNLDVINQWYYDPRAFGIMSDCANTAIGVWSANNGFDRSVVVAVYGQPA